MPLSASKPVRSPRRRRPQARGVLTRRRVLAAAEHAFATRGYEATSMNEIAEAARASVGTLYHHFPDKRALLLALIDDWGDRELERERGMDLSRYLGADPRGALRADLMARAQRLLRGGSFQLVLLQLAASDHDVRARLGRIQQVGRERLRDFVAYGQQRGVFRRGMDPLAAAFLIQNAINVTAIEFFVHQQREIGMEPIIDELTDMICRYLLEEPR